MKQLYNLLLILTTVFFFACQEDDEMSSLSGKGYLRLQVGQNAELTTKAEEYNSERIAVYIKDSENKIVEHTTDFDAEWKDKDIELSPGEYTIEAESYGWDGEAGEDKAYYKGSTTVTIEKDKSVDAEVVCYLANVKVTVAFEQDFLTALGDGTITVQVQNVNGQTTYKAMDFSKSAEKQVAYFAATDIDVKYTVTTDKGKNEGTREIREVKAKDHYILNFRLEQEGTENVTVKVDPTMTLYEYTFNVSPEPKNTAVLSANAWAKLAYLKAEKVSAATGTDISSMKFQYRKKDATDWTDATATLESEVYSGKITGLDANTVYEYRLANADGTYSVEAEFTTEVAATLTNGDFEDWCVRSAATAMGSSNTTFPCSASDYDAGKMFWDTSNRGANSAGQEDPTNFVKEPVVSGTYAACLETTEVMGFLAAASLYTGQFVSATMDWGSFSAVALIDFGRPFTSRPISLKGHYKYTPAKVKVGGDLPDNATVSADSDDQCSIYIALAKGTHRVDNSDSSTFLSLDNIKNDDNIIAYGELPSGAATSGEGYTDFTIPLKYKNLTDTPTHIIVVCSASKYGDYMTGGNGSTLLVDNFSLVYDGEPTIWDLSANN